ncbi:hypothetical protein GCM10010168_53350 [Actinoplanes ianthinogenes]|uniref:Uncharacterized protein n=1 Tax=Actinoplanes ianthinogenes TaxID=122358 RepID=A0ABM7LQY1_9ACTN|nr:hypothetical protein [Actinoplanes ianthinogenes]BCJ41667.1 hypothetical protein Aiant_23240 [Actinoplanes ianthinogenes]GGR28548.1 hypothetical protein GCM10010168_53350 [Actinoplanes ianthinogenes]
MPFRPSPASLAAAPLAYPSHDYSGEGVIYTVRLGEETVGFLSHKTGDYERVGFLPRPDLSDNADTVRVMVYDILRRYAADGRPMVDAFAHILDVTQNDGPVTAPLDGLRGD